MIIDIVLYYLSGRGGTEEAIIKLQKGLIKRGHRVRVFLAYESEHKEWLNFIDEFYYFGQSLPWNSPHTEYAKKYKELLETMEKPQVVLPTLHPFLNYVCYKVLNENSTEHTPIVSWCHLPIDRLGDRQLLCYADYHLAISKSIMLDLERLIAPHMIELVGNPVTINKSSICNRPEGKLKLLFLGRLVNFQKRLDVLFKGLAKVQGDWSLQIIGSGIDTEMLKQLAISLDIDKNIEWLGWQDKPWDIIKETSILMLTSDFEGFSIAVLEALARGIPVLATKCEGTMELIENNKNGWLINKEDSNQLANILNQIQESKLNLPSQEDCISSVRKFDDDFIIDRIENVLLDQYTKNTNTKTIDIVLFSIDGTKPEEKLLLNIYKGLIRRNHRVRVFQLWAPVNKEWEKEVQERYYYGLNNVEFADLEVYAISYKKLLNDIGLPDIIISPLSPHLSYLCKYAVRDSKEKISVVSLITSSVDSCNGKWSLGYADAHLALNEAFEKDIKKSLDTEKIYALGEIDIDNIESMNQADNDLLVKNIETALLQECKQ
ncbi:glycosyltransferase [Inconstantimicrobium mannanitabidum]|uniref:Uncharacterized protein n=1 Tax=Inconstantimicrobium mannanitabidum TaxID=1604901 RepID=A0ACB5RHT3_9CLOT|nr:glycosyltransferase [Clostridium sp. TW13]GKX68670.1 hypothetical protein rsdtw13_39280 [Clostridium sp. TW13]